MLSIKKKTAGYLQTLYVAEVSTISFFGGGWSGLALFFRKNIHKYTRSFLWFVDKQWYMLN